MVGVALCLVTRMWADGKGHFLRELVSSYIGYTWFSFASVKALPHPAPRTNTTNRNRGLHWNCCLLHSHTTKHACTDVKSLSFLQRSLPPPKSGGDVVAICLLVTRTFPEQRGRTDVKFALHVRAHLRGDKNHLLIFWPSFERRHRAIFSTWLVTL